MDLTPSISANRPDALFIGPRPFSFVFFFITFYRATSWLRAYPLLKWSSTIFFPFFFFFFFSHATSWLKADTLLNRSSTIFLPFFFFSRHLVAQSKHAAQSVLDRFFLYYATSWLRADMLHQSLLTIFFFNNSPLLFPLTPPRGSEQKQTLAEATRPAPFPRDK